MPPRKCGAGCRNGRSDTSPRRLWQNEITATPTARLSPERAIWSTPLARLAVRGSIVTLAPFAFGFKGKWGGDGERVAFLFALYERLTSLQAVTNAPG